VISCEAGVEKPGSGIFETALSAMGVAPDEALHVGDDLVSDYEGSRAAGMHGVLLVRHGRAPEGILSIPTLEGLVAIVDGDEG